MSDFSERAPYTSRPDLGHPLMQDISESMLENGVKIPLNGLRLGNAPGPLRTHVPNPGGELRAVEAIGVTFYRLGDEELKLQPYRRLPDEVKEVVPVTVVDYEVSEGETLVQALINFWVTSQGGKYSDKVTRDVLVNEAGDIFDGGAAVGSRNEDIYRKMGYIADPGYLLLGSVPDNYIHPNPSLFAASKVEAVPVEPRGRAYTSNVYRVRGNE